MVGNLNGGQACCEQRAALTSREVTLPSHVQLCKMLLPDMRARGRGLVVNIGSATASLMQEAPLLQGERGGCAAPACHLMS